MAVVRPPVRRRQLLVVRPAVERRHREVIDDDAFAGTHEVEECGVGAIAPAQLGPPAFEIVQDDDIVRRERFGAGAAELLHDADLELAGVLERLAQQRRRAAPVVAVLAGDDQHGNLRRRRGRRIRRLLRVPDALSRTDQQGDRGQSSFHGAPPLNSSVRSMPHNEARQEEKKGRAAGGGASCGSSA